MTAKKDSVIKLKLCSNKTKQPFRSRENIFAIYFPKKCTIPESRTCVIDTEIIADLPQNSTAFLTRKFKGQKIKELKGPGKKRLWIKLLNDSYFNKHTIEKGDIVGYLLSRDSKISIQKYEKKKNTRYLRTASQRSGTGRAFGRNQRRRQTGGFLNRYDFAYAGRGTLNQLGKIAPSIIKNASGQIDEIARNRIEQIIKQGGAEVERVAQKIIRGALEELYSTPFRMLGNFGKKQVQKIKRQLFKQSCKYFFLK